MGWMEIGIVVVLFIAILGLYRWYAKRHPGWPENSWWGPGPGDGGDPDP